LTPFFFILQDPIPWSQSNGLWMFNYVHLWRCSRLVCLGGKKIFCWNNALGYSFCTLDFR
jgi:hypothetical protein